MSISAVVLLATALFVLAWITHSIGFHRGYEAFYEENERLRTIVRNATVESEAEFIILSLTQDEWREIVGHREQDPTSD